MCGGGVELVVGDDAGMSWLRSSSAPVRIVGACGDASLLCFVFAFEQFAECEQVLQVAPLFVRGRCSRRRRSNLREVESKLQ